jgi:hypothetical protein
MNSGALVVLARRLLTGQERYGHLDLRHDPRDWRRERSEEIEDALLYTAIGEVSAVGRGSGS